MQMALFHSFLQLSNILLCIYMSTTSYLCFSGDGRLGCFHAMAIIHSAAVTKGITVFSGYMPRGGLAGSLVNLLLVFEDSPRCSP